MVTHVIIGNPMVFEIWTSWASLFIRSPVLLDSRQNDWAKLEVRFGVSHDCQCSSLEVLEMGKAHNGIVARVVLKMEWAGVM